MKRILPLGICLGLMGMILFFYPLSFATKEKYLREEGLQPTVLPSEITGIAALDFKGLAADFQLLQAIFFIGQKIDRSEMITVEDWQRFIRMIHAVIDLDPYFFDPYYFAGALLAWGPGMYEDAIGILKRALDYRPDDAFILFRIGFVYYYFLNDFENGARYIAAAAQKPNAPDFYAPLAARLSYYAGDTDFSLLLLKSMLKDTRSPEIRKYYEKRILALEGMQILENAVRRFQEKRQDSPKNLEELVDAGFLETIPEDPYGGNFYLMPTGRIYTTSKLVELKK